MLCCQYCGKALDSTSAVCDCRRKPKIDNGGPAFPHDNQELGNRHRVAQPGMTLRDYFAGQALAGMLADTRIKADMADYAHNAYRAADALLAERAKGKAP